MENIRGARLRKFNLRKIILGVRMHFRHKCTNLEKDLGIMIDSELTFVEHMHCASARKAYGI